MRALSGEYQPSTFDSIREQVALYEASDGRVGGTLEGRRLIIVTHRGAKTGKLHKSPLIRIPHDAGYIVVASYGGAPANPAWYHNLMANPVVDVQDGSLIRTMRAAEATGDEKDGLWPVCEAIWPDFPEYRSRTARDIPMFVLTPEPAEPSPDGRAGITVDRRVD